MPSSGLFDEKVQSYLDTLSPEARRMIMRRLGEAGDAAADKAAPPSPVAPERPVAQPLIRREIVAFDARDELFAPFLPFLIDEILTERQTGFLRRSTIENLWTYLVREALPEQAGRWDGVRDMTADAAEAARRSDIPKLSDAAFAMFRRLDEAGRHDDRVAQKFSARIGGEAALADLRDMMAVRPHLADIGSLVAGVPSVVQAADGAEKSIAAQVAGALRGPPERAAWIAAALVPRLANPGSLTRIACLVTGATDIVQVRRSQAAAFVDVALAAADRHAVRFVAAVSAPLKTAEALAELKAFHEIVRHSTLAINLTDDRGWSQRLAALKRHVSQPLAQAVENVVPSFRSALGADRLSRPSEADRVEALRVASLLAAARRNRESLAVNAVVDRLWPVADQALQTWGRAALDKLRGSKGSERETLLAVTATFVDLSADILGPEYAAHQRRAREKALAG